MTSGRDTKERLLTEAVKLFAEHGYHGVSVREICEAAGANQAAVNYHFRSKFGLYRQVLTTGFEKLGAFRPVPRLADNPDKPEEQLTAWIRWYLERILRTDDALVLSHVIAKELREPTEAFDMLVERSVAPLFATLVEIVAALVQKEQNSKAVITASLGIISQCVFYITGRPMLERMFPHQLTALLDHKALSEIIASVTLGGLASLREAHDG